jgi:hypothetical protein
MDYEEIRDRFFKITDIDMRHLDPIEVHQLLELLPAALLFLHKEYFMPAIYEDDDVRYVLKKASA